jgi:hypothetical protein
MAMVWLALGARQTMEDTISGEGTVAKRTSPADAAVGAHRQAQQSLP